jgi:hypothetical protein
MVSGGFKNQLNFISIYKGLCMQRLILLIFIFSATLNAQGRLIPNPLKNIPKWVRQEFSSQHLDKKYTIVFRLYPYSIRGDFNGDGRKDVAIQIAAKQNGNAGIAIFHGKKPQSLNYAVSIFGAGETFGNAGNDFKWVKTWHKIENSRVTDIILESNGNKRGNIHWNGSKYVWIQSK